MSLINDALKKAQKQRTEESPPLGAMPSIGGEPAARIAKRSKPLGFNSLLMWVGVGGGTVAILLVGGFFALRRMNSPTAPSLEKTAVVAQTAPAPAQALAVTPIAVKPGTAYVLATAPIPAPAETPPPVAIAESKPVVVAPPPEPEAPKPVVPAAKLPPKSVAYIEAQRVAGIRASATDSKVLMNDRVYRIGDIVEHQLGLKLVGITATSLTFEDESGARYTRNF